MNKDSLSELTGVWIHKTKGTEYEIIGVSNTLASPGREEEYPVEVFYEGKSGLWSRKIDHFLRDYSPKPRQIPYKAHLHPTSPVVSVIYPTQDPKYGIQDNKLVNLSTCIPIPDNEPDTGIPT